MPDWFTDFLTGASISTASSIWNATMGLIGGIMTASPKTFSNGAWTFTSNTLYPWALSIGVSMLNMFFIIAIWQAVKNFHQNITLEMVIEALIRIVVANVIFLNLKTLMDKMFEAATAMVGDVLVMTPPKLVVDDIDMGSVLFFQLFGMLFILAAIVCSFLILITVYTRYIKLYVLMIMAPFAVPTILGGHEVNRTFHAWIKTFILNVFEIVVIAIVMVISWKLGSAGTTFNNATSLIGSVADGFWDALNSLFSMVLVTAAVKSANTLMSKAFGL